MNDPHIHVALATDDNYFEGLLVTAWSIAANCSRPSDLIFHILDGGISQDNISLLRKSLAEFNCSLDFIRIDQGSQLNGCGTWHGNSSMTFARLLLPSLLPTVKHVIYSDVDFLWLKDVAQLWQQTSDALLLQHARHDQICTISSTEHEWCRARGTALIPSAYFCAGMLLLNLEKFRAEALHVKMLDFIRANGGSAPTQDQTVLNMFCQSRGDIGIVDSSWQITTGNSAIERIKSGLVLHYASDTPWKPLRKVNHLLSNYHVLWHCVNGRIRGISAWASLRQHNSAPSILLCRTIFLLAANFIAVKWLLCALMRLRGQSSNINYLLSKIRNVVIDRTALDILRSPQNTTDCKA